MGKHDYDCQQTLVLKSRNFGQVVIEAVNVGGRVGKAPVDRRAMEAPLIVVA